MSSKEDSKAISTEELLRRLKQIESDDKRRTIQRHELNNALQVSLLTMNKAQETSLEHMGSITAILANQSKLLTQLSSTIFGPNGDNGLRGRVVDLERCVEELKESNNEAINSIKDDVKHLWIKLGLLAGVLGNLGFSVKQIFFS